MRKISWQEKDRFNHIIRLAVDALVRQKLEHWSFDIKHIDEAAKYLLALPDKDQVGFLLAAIEPIHVAFSRNDNVKRSDLYQKKSNTARKLFIYVLKSKLILDEEDVEQLVEGFLQFRNGYWEGFTGWPFDLFVKAVERNFKNDLPDGVRKSLEKLRTEFANLLFISTNSAKIISKIDSILFNATGSAGKLKPTLFIGMDEFTNYANPIIEKQPGQERQVWFKLMQLAQQTPGTKPTQKFFSQSDELIKKLPADKFKKIVVAWFDFLSKLKESNQSFTVANSGRKPRTYQVLVFLDKVNIDPIRSFVWMCCRFHDANTLKVIAALCERCFKKMPGEGPVAASIGNACLFVLFESKGLQGISHLSRLKTRIKQTTTQSVIERYLKKAADKEGLSVNEIEDMVVEDFELKEGRREFELGGFKAVLSVEGVGDVKISWIKPDGTPQKTAPAIIKDKHAAKLKKVKDTAEQIEASLVAQRERLDRMYRSQVEMSWSYFVKHYFSHRLLSYLTKRVIWKFRNRNKDVDAIFINGKWTTYDLKEVKPSDSTMVSLWHPALAGAEEISSWRKLLVDEQLRQPIKQAFREVYLLTDAETNTRVYSNRMAAHILKQHQFNSLAKARGWKYSLLNTYDDENYNGSADLELPALNLRAEFWVSEVNTQNEWNFAGIWNYVSTDQVRFVDKNTKEPVELISVPPVIFSEVMRDVDLFVGVASVGNDPTWNDSGGLPAYRDYWNLYSFGELSEIAKTRKEVLASLLPRLKIAPVATIRDKFLVIQGKMGTYKIHIGSTNILMEPNDQYLCIVPDRTRKDSTKNVYLPFEGDSGLSVIISKAFMLADDESITDSSILRQIRLNVRREM